MRFFLALLAVFLILMTNLSFSSVSAQNVYELRLGSSVWNHSTIGALIVTASNESWWNPAYVNNTIRAIGQWNEAINEFAINQSKYNYLLGTSISVQVSNETFPGYDVYINWTESINGDMSSEIGLTTIYSSSRNIITNCTMSLGVKTNIGVTLGNTDMQNIALHELGHSLGLSHSNYSRDIMYPLYNVGGSSALLSTLDVYGVATMFAWKLDPANIFPVRQWLNETSVTLPADIPYQYLSISAENTPAVTIIDNPISQFFIMLIAVVAMPIIAIPVIILIIMLVFAVLVTRRSRSSGTLKNSA